MTDPTGVEHSVSHDQQASAIFDRDMRYLAASPQWMSDYGLTEPIVGRCHYEVFPKIGEAWKAVHRRCLEGATESSAGERFERSDGGECWIRWEVRPWRDRSGAIGGVVITTEIVAAAALAAPEASRAGEERARFSRGTARGVGARIWSVRLHMDRTQEAFAALLGVDVETVRAWESGEKVDRKALNLVAGVTGAPIEWLIAGLSTTQVDAIRTTAAAARAPVHEAIWGEDGVRPQIARNDREAAKAISPAWRFQTARRPASEPGAAGVSAGPRSSHFLHLPDVTLWSGARAAAYRLRKGGSPDRREELSLSVVLDGRRRYEQGGRDVDGGYGSATFASSAVAGRSFYDPCGRYLNVFVPLEALLGRVPQIETRLLRPIAPDDEALRLLTAYAAALMKTEGGIDRELADCVADHVVDLCAILLGAEGDERVRAEGRGVRAARTAAIREAIDAGAASPGFSIQTVADRLGLTPREVHELLEESGVWFSECVEARRVEIVKRRLADPDFGGMNVHELAFACGVADFEPFDRLFRTRFGETPAEADRRRRG